VELEAVIGCDSAAGADGTSLSAGLVESLSSEGDRRMLDKASTDCCGSCGGESVPFVGGHEVCSEPEALERRERSLAISRFLAVGFQRLILVARLIWKRFPQDKGARSAGVQGYRTMNAGLQPIREGMRRIKSSQGVRSESSPAGALMWVVIVWYAREWCWTHRARPICRGEAIQDGSGVGE
jgi:hypothetical protein